MGNLDEKSESPVTAGAGLVRCLWYVDFLEGVVHRGSAPLLVLLAVRDFCRLPCERRCSELLGVRCALPSAPVPRIRQRC